MERRIIEKLRVHFGKELFIDTKDHRVEVAFRSHVTMAAHVYPDSTLTFAFVLHNFLESLVTVVSADQSFETNVKKTSLF